MSLAVYDAGTVRAALAMPACIDLMAQVQIALSNGRIRLPLRTHLPVSERGESLLVMPGALDAPHVFGAKLVSLFPGNESLPTIQGYVLLFDGANGAPLALVEAASLTAIRTAAASGAATRALARTDASRLALLGYGVQADSHLDAMCAVRPVEDVRVWGPDPQRAAAFAARRSTADVPVVAAASPEAAIRGADLICAVSAARSPIIEASWLAPGCHLNLVGAHTADTREADGATLAAARVFTEITTFALSEAGDIVLAMAEGQLAEDGIAGEIGAVLGDRIPGRQHEDQITLYKSLGNTAQDLAAAHHVHIQAQAGAGEP
jgi:ornithine cyclodeaminase